jgi:cob(I)alamin adenosyltransferase
MSERGDSGLTLGACGLVVSKDSEFIYAEGDTDDLQALLGSVMALSADECGDFLASVEGDLSEVMGVLYQNSIWNGANERILRLEDLTIVLENFDNCLSLNGETIKSRVNLSWEGCVAAENSLMVLRDERLVNGDVFDEKILEYFDVLSNALNLENRDKSEVVVEKSVPLETKMIFAKLKSRLEAVRFVLKREENEVIGGIEKNIVDIFEAIHKNSEWENGDSEIKKLEELVKSYELKVGDFGKFLIPGETESDASVNLCRTGSRLAEERLVAWKNEKEKENEKFDGRIIKYFNKLSTYFNLVWRTKLEN